MPKPPKKPSKSARAESYPVLSERWTPNTFAQFDYGSRSHFIPATAQIVERVLSANFSPNGQILELGSGMGFMRERLLPQDSPYRAIIQSDGSASIVNVRNAALLHDQEPVQLIDPTRKIPYDNGSLDGVVGFASFDTFLQLPRAVAEVDRVLRPGGTFVHFLDLTANQEPVVLERDPLKIPFNEPGVAGSILLINRGVVVNTINRMRRDNPLRPLLERYLEVPAAAYYSFVDKPVEAALLAQAVLAQAKETQFQRVDTNEYFSERLATAFAVLGYDVNVSIEEASQVSLGAIDVPGSANVWTNDFGVVKTSWDDELAAQDPSARKVVSRVLVITAKKPSQ